METMTKSEKELLKKLQAKQKRVSRQEKEFLEYADKHKEELLQRWNLSDKNNNKMSDNSLQRLYEMMKHISQLYGTDINSLLNYISTDQQVNYFRKTHQNGNFKSKSEGM